MSGLLGRRYDSMFMELLESHIEAAQAHRNAGKSWCVFWPTVGRKYSQGGIVLVGRAVNGWEDTTFVCKDLNSGKSRKGLIRRCRESFAPADECPMSWVQKQWNASCGYRTCRSQFWQMARRLTRHNEYSGDDWPSVLAWTNLMRISPASRGNPPGWSYSAQLEHAAKLLDYEIKTLQPVVAVLLTGRDWYRPFQEETDLFSLKKVGKGYVHYVGQHGRTRLIVSDHPQARPQTTIMDQIAPHLPS